MQYMYFVSIHLSETAWFLREDFVPRETDSEAELEVKDPFQLADVSYVKVNEGRSSVKRQPETTLPAIRKALTSVQALPQTSSQCSSLYSTSRAFCSCLTLRLQ